MGSASSLDSPRARSSSRCCRFGATAPLSCSHCCFCRPSAEACLPCFQWRFKRVHGCSFTSLELIQMSYSRVAILGTGLIGSSVGLALKASRPQIQVVGYDASGDNLRRAQSVKAIDRRGSLRDALTDAELVVVSTPVGAMKALFEEIAPILPTQALVIDTGSTKAEVLRWA